jgi:G3E family GTPase
MALIPATILTGFLGAGKTTLLNRLLHEDHGQRIAVIENEFGEENIDNEILVQDTREQIVEMNNGCICCTVRGDLI